MNIYIYYIHTYGHIVFIDWYFMSIFPFRLTHLVTGDIVFSYLKADSIPH